MHTTYKSTNDTNSPELKAVIDSIDAFPQDIQIQICLLLIKKIGHSWFDNFKVLADALPYGWQKRFVADYNKKHQKKINPMTITRLVKGETVNLDKTLFDHLSKFAKKELMEQKKVKEGLQKLQRDFLME